MCAINILHKLGHQQSEHGHPWLHLTQKQCIFAEEFFKFFFLQFTILNVYLQFQLYFLIYQFILIYFLINFLRVNFLSARLPHHCKVPSFSTI